MNSVSTELPDAAVAGRGVYVGILGIDGSGKTTLANGLTERLAARGHSPEFVRWRDIAAQVDRTDFPYVPLRQLLVETWRTRYGGATDAPSLEVQHGPSSYEDFMRAGFDRGPANPVGVHRSGVVATAMFEFTAELLIHAEVIAERLAAGKIVVTDSFGYKNVIKMLRVANEIPHGDVPKDLIVRMCDFIADAYSSEFLQPDVGIFLKVTPDECYRRITAHRDGIGSVEDMGFAGRTGRESYIELQASLLAEYEQLATSWGWHIVDVSESSAAETLDVVSEIVLADIVSEQNAAGHQGSE